MGTFLPRSSITDYVLDVLAEVITVGDGKAPEEGGWTDDPNSAAAEFIPYVVVNPMPVSDHSGPIADSHADYKVPFSLGFYGISREQADVSSDWARQHLEERRRDARIIWQNQLWKIQKIEINSIGGITRSDNTEPSIYNQFDVITLWVSHDINAQVPEPGDALDP